MPVIEGVGDEVLNVLIIALVIFLGIVGWWSTSISEQPLIRTVLILEPRHHTAPENSTNVIPPSPPEDTGQPDPIISNDVRPEVVDAQSPSSSANKNQSSTGQQTSDGVDQSSSSDQNLHANASTSATLPVKATDSSVDAPSTSDEEVPTSEVSSTANELRRRRLQFFEDRQGVECAPKTCSTQSTEDGRVLENCTQAGTSSSSNEDTNNQKDSTHETITGSPTSDPCLACDDIRIRLKFLNDNQKLVQGKLQEPLGDFKRRNFAVEMAARKVIRLIFNGQVLQSDDRTLQNYGLFDNCVVHCLVHNQRTSNTNVDNTANGNTAEDVHFGVGDAGEAREWDLSNVLYVLMFLVLAGIWYLRANFSQLFSATSTVALFGLSGIFVIFLVGMYIPDQEVLRT